MEKTKTVTMLMLNNIITGIASIVELENVCLQSSHILYSATSKRPQSLWNILAIYSGMKTEKITIKDY